MDIQEVIENIELVAEMMQKVEKRGGWWVCKKDQVPIAPHHYEPCIVWIYYLNHCKTAYCGAFGDM